MRAKLFAVFRCNSYNPMQEILWRESGLRGLLSV
jgi:hypothetical protein